MRKLRSLFRRCIAVVLLLVPLEGFGLTGIILTPYSFTGISAGTGDGQIAVRFAGVADEAYPTQWRLVGALGTTSWMNVTKSGVVLPVTKRALTWGIEFQRVPTNAVVRPPVARTVTILEDQRVTLKVKY